MGDSDTEDDELEDMLRQEEEMAREEEEEMLLSPSKRQKSDDGTRTFGNVPLSQQSPAGALPSPSALGNVPLSQPSQAATGASASSFHSPPQNDDVCQPATAEGDDLCQPSTEAVDALDAGQQQAFDLALSGRNLFLTGGPGTGKSFTLLKIIEALKEKHGDPGVLVAAPTGVAALIAEGQTLHSKPGPGVPKGTTEAFGNMRSKTSSKNWHRIKVLVVDEISMVDAEFLDWYMANVGYVQLIFCGDFDQLPPVPDKQGSLNNIEHLRNCIRAARRKDNRESWEEAGNRDPAVDTPGMDRGGWLDMSKNTPFGMRETTAKFAFQSIAWREAGFHVHHLRHVHRTKEPLLLDALTDLRAGEAGSGRIRALIQATARPLPPRDGVEPTTLYPKKRNVQVENSQRLQQLDAASARKYDAYDAVELHEEAPPWVRREELFEDQFFKDDCQAAKVLELRLKAQVRRRGFSSISTACTRTRRARRRAPTQIHKHKHKHKHAQTSTYKHPRANTYSLSLTRTRTHSLAHHAPSAACCR